MSNLRIHFQPNGVILKVEEGTSLLEAARRAGFMLQTECGGLGTCRRCRVKIASGELFNTAEPNLTAREKKEGYALACIARVVGDLEVFIPPASEFKFASEARPVLLSPGERPGAELADLGLPLAPLAKRFQVRVAAPTLQNNASDFERLKSALAAEGQPPPYRINVAALRKLPDALRQTTGELSLLALTQTEGTEILDLGLPSELRLLGLALDVGTTTLFARLLDLESGEALAEASDFNWQIPCGADVIHRIIYAAKPGGLDELQRLALTACDGLIARLCEAAAASRERIVAVVAAGNTTMTHLFLRLDPRMIREEPYVPAVTHLPLLTAAEVGLDVFPRAPVFFSPGVASYVGGDVTAGLLAAGVHREARLTLYVDLGTNGEVALGNRDWLTACACSAGPAFEGAGVRCGMRAIPGAIDQIKLDLKTGALSFRVIGGGSPKGICGSGLIDLLAELRASGRIDARGKFIPEADPQRIRPAGRRSEILLAKESDTEGAGDVVVSETDLDNLIRAKGAIFAGILTLLKGVGLAPADIERVVIAGGFGRYLDIDNAVRIGMLPDLPRERFSYIGNGSLRGAGLALLSQQAREELELITHNVTYFELSTWQGYLDEFMAALFLPHTDLSLFPSVRETLKRQV